MVYGQCLGFRVRGKFKINILIHGLEFQIRYKVYGWDWGFMVNVRIRVLSFRVNKYTLETNKKSQIKYLALVTVFKIGGK